MHVVYDGLVLEVLHYVHVIEQDVEVDLQVSKQVGRRWCRENL